MSAMPFSLVVYDIADDRRRSTVASILGDFGPRVQLSVFEVELLTPSVHATLLRRLAEAIDDVEDQVRVYDLAGLSNRRTIIGNRVLEEREPFYIV